MPEIPSYCLHCLMNSRKLLIPSRNNAKVMLHLCNLIDYCLLTRAS